MMIAYYWRVEFGIENSIIPFHNQTVVEVGFAEQKLRPYHFYRRYLSL